MLRLLALPPPQVTEMLLQPLVRLYPRLRPGHAARLRACFAAAPFAPRLRLDKYYAMRLRLLLRGLAAHDRAGHGSRTDAGRDQASRRIEGEEHYRDALRSGHPTALIGLHAGLLEDLHRTPQAEPPGEEPAASAHKPFRILTAPAFSPPLTAYMAKGRARDGKAIAWIGSDGPLGLESALREVIAEKGVLALMADQHPGPSGNCEYLALWDRIQVPYPGRLLRFLAGQNFRFVPVSARLLADGSSAFRFHAAWDLGGGSLGGCVRGFLEEAIAAAPDQWNWSYPKIRPLSGPRKA